MRNLCRRNGIAVSVDEESGEVFITNLINPSVTVQVRHLADTPQGPGLTVSTPHKMTMGEDEGGPAVIIKR